MKSKHTKGIASYIETYLNGSKGFEINFGTQGECISDFVYTEADAQLIADTFNVTNETNKTPRELQKSHDELLNALEGMRNQFKGKENNGFLERLSISNAEQAIKNATK